MSRRPRLHFVLWDLTLGRFLRPGGHAGYGLQAGGRDGVRSELWSFLQGGECFSEFLSLGPWWRSCASEFAALRKPARGTYVQPFQTKARSLSVKNPDKSIVPLSVSL